MAVQKLAYIRGESCVFGKRKAEDELVSPNATILAPLLPHNSGLEKLW